MDVFSRTFLPATAEAELPIPVVSRHMMVLRHCVAPEETALLVARCHRPGVPMAGSFLLVLTNRSLVVSRESRLLHRVQLHLAAPLRELSNVVWTRHDRSGIELACTAADGVHERFWLPIRDVRRIRQVDAMLSHAFRFRVMARSTQQQPVAVQPLAPRPAPRPVPRPVPRPAPRPVPRPVPRPADLGPISVVGSLDHAHFP